MRRILYKTARFLGDINAMQRGRYPQRVVRKMVYRQTGRLARTLTRWLGVSR